MICNSFFFGKLPKRSNKISDRILETPSSYADEENFHFSVGQSSICFVFITRPMEQLTDPKALVKEQPGGTVMAPNTQDGLRRASVVE